MQTIPLGSTGRTTTRLGFGCSSIMGVLNRRQSLALLESAFDAGIRHFDTAPMYGYGEAESCLGEFLSRHNGQVTVTTKFGIPPAKSRTLARTVRAVGGSLAQRFPALKKFAAKPLPHRQCDTVAIANPIFTAEMARTSLERSLRALRTDKIDLWLLHDVKPIDLTSDPANDDLLRLLEDSVREGKAGMFGVGSDRAVIPELQSQHPEYCGAVQYEWSVLNPPVLETSSFRINHRALSRHFHALAGRLKNDPERCKRWSGEVEHDLANPDSLADLMLRASYILNPACILLFSSKRSEHIRRNVKVAGKAELDAPARRFYTLLQAAGDDSQLWRA